MEVKINGEFPPRNTDYSKYYTPLLRVKLTSENKPFNGLEGMFTIRVFRMTTDIFSYKDYMCYLGMASNTNQVAKIKIIDKNPEVANVYVVGEIKDNYCYLYAKGGNKYDAIAIQILFAPNKGYIEILPHEDILIDSVVNPILPVYYTNNVVFNSGWNATTSKQRQTYAQNSKVKLDYFISTSSSDCIVENYKIADLSIKAKYKKNFYCNWIKTDGSTSGICELQINPTTNGSELLCIKNVPTSSYIQLNVEYEISGV